MLKRPFDCTFCLVSSRYMDMKNLGIEDPNAFKDILKLAINMGEFRTEPFAESFLVISRYSRDDPYKEKKNEYSRIAREIMARYQAKLPSEWLKLSTVMNSFDTSILGYNFSLEELEKNADGFLVDESRVIDAISGAKIAYVLDNAGEHIFDLEVVRRLRNKGNTVDIYVRSEPYEIDVTKDDLALVDGIVATPGNVPPIYKRDFSGYDLVISKGIANFEAAIESYEMGFDASNVLFAFKAKCTVLQSILNTGKRTLIIAKWKTIYNMLKKFL